MQTATFPGRFESLERITEFVTPATKEAGLDDIETYAILLAVDEACSNIIKHAYCGEGRGDIECACDVKDDKLTIVLRDWGESFDPSTIPEPDFAVPLEDLELCGAGLVLIHKIVDEVHYQSAPDTGNVLTLIKHR